MAKKELCRDLNFKMSAILGPVILMYVVAFPLGDDVGVQVLDDLFTYIWALAHQALGLNFIILCTTQVSYEPLFLDKKNHFVIYGLVFLSTILQVQIEIFYLQLLRSKIYYKKLGNNGNTISHKIRWTHCLWQNCVVI